MAHVKPKAGEVVSIYGTPVKDVLTYDQDAGEVWVQTGEPDAKGNVPKELKTGTVTVAAKPKKA